MSKKYVLSASVFKTKKAALAKIKEWERKDELFDPPPSVFEVVKIFEPVRDWRLSKGKKP